MRARVLLGILLVGVVAGMEWEAGEAKAALNTPPKIANDNATTAHRIPSAALPPPPPPVDGNGGGHPSPQFRPVDCAELLMDGERGSGIYEIFPFTCTCSNPVLVWCDMETDGGGWTVFLNRESYPHLHWQEPHRQLLDFNRTWQAYKDGFGYPGGEYWLGNELLHVMTQSRSYSVRLDVELASGGRDSATYETIRVADEDSRYKIQLLGSKNGGSSISNCFNYLSNRYFTSVDRDHDSFSGNCAAKQGGGWWYYNCRYFNPTRASINSTLELTCYGITQLSLTALQLKLRPVICDATVKTIHLNDMDCGCHDPVVPPRPTQGVQPAI